MNRIIKVAIVGFVGVFSLLLVSVVASPAAEKIFNFVDITPLSGPAAGWGIPDNRAYKYAVDDYNKKGGLLVGGEHYKINHIAYDNKYQPAESVALLNRAIFKDNAKYVAIMGYNSCIVCAPITTSNKVLLLACSSGGAELTNPKHPLVFRSPNPSFIGVILYYEDFMKEFGVKTLALVNPDDDAGYQASKFINGFVKTLSPPLTVVADEFYTRGTPDFAPIILRILAKKPDMIDLGISSPGDTALFIKQVHEAGYAGVHLNSSGLISLEALYKATGEAAIGHFAIGNVVEPPTPQYKAHTERYLKEYGGTAVPISLHHSYDALTAIFMAIEKANTFDTEIVAEVMGNMEWTGLPGPLRWMGKEKILGFGINRQISYPWHMNRLGMGGKLEKWRAKSVPREK